jgi:hypothetical protein
MTKTKTPRTAARSTGGAYTFSSLTEALREVRLLVTHLLQRPPEPPPAAPQIGGLFPMGAEMTVPLDEAVERIGMDLGLFEHTGKSDKEVRAISADIIYLLEKKKAVKFEVRDGDVLYVKWNKT